GTLEAGGRTWTRYQARVVLEGVNQPIVIEVAMASQNGAGTLLVMLQAREALFEAYATTVLLPALEQFAPLQ
ncbi:MAG: hypothetical protein JXN59_13520, partial [Anaerolineae bacterium]|nr:hypothetical protein [Anaerolineae bacterium]